MTTTAEQPAAEGQLLTREQHKEASIQLLDTITTDVYFSKLAEYSIVPRTQEEAQELLAIGLNIDKLSQHPAVKKAEQRKQKSFLGFANDRLTEKMAEMGVIQPPPSGDDEAINKLAEIYTSEPAVQEAILSVYGE